jgi:hypothetical protein
MTSTYDDIATRMEWLHLDLATVCRSSKLDYTNTRRAFLRGRGLDEEGLAQLDKVLTNAENAMLEALIGRTPTTARPTVAEILRAALVVDPRGTLMTMAEILAEGDSKRAVAVRKALIELLATDDITRDAARRDTQDAA